MPTSTAAVTPGVPMAGLEPRAWLPWALTMGILAGSGVVQGRLTGRW